MSIGLTKVIMNLPKEEYNGLEEPSDIKGYFVKVCNEVTND